MLQRSDALLVVDLQKDFVTGSLAVPGAFDILAPVWKTMIAFTEAELPIFMSQDWHPPDHYSFKTWPPHCVQGTEGAELIFRPKDFTRIQKGEYSAFDGTALFDRLIQQEITRLYVCGLATEYCVLSTTLDALKYGFKASLITDAVASVTELGGIEATTQMYVAGAEATVARYVK